MSNSAISKAWQWSVEASPILNLWRWIRHMGYPNRTAFDLLSSAALPGQIDALIRTTVKRSKLWGSERAEIARELIAHSQDGLESGRSETEIANAFGEPKRVAKLMRRSMKRKRPLYWRTYRNMKRATFAMILILIIGYGSLAARFFMGAPSIKRNYIAELNAQNDGYSENEKAWSVYRSVDIEWQRLTYASWQQQLIENPDLNKGLYRSSVLYPLYGTEAVHTNRDEAAAMVRLFEPQLAQLREAAHRPVSGMVLSDSIERVEIEPGVWVTDPIMPSSDPKQQGTLTTLLLPELGMIRQYAMLLMADTKLAMGEGDWDRAHSDLIASLSMSRQVNRTGFLINHLVAIAIRDQTSSTLETIFAEYPEAFSRDQLIELTHAFALNQTHVTMKLDAEMMFFDDILQRAYTDDGHGNGRLTHKGMQILFDGGYLDPSDQVQRPIDLENVKQSLTGPISMIAIEDRKSQFLKHRAIIDQVYRVLRDGPEYLGLVSGSETQLERETGLFKSPVELLMPALSQALEREFISIMSVEATLTMLAIEIFKRDHGQYPETLHELVPQYLPELPNDYFNPGHSIQYVIYGDGYQLYSAGTDGDLDGGVDLKPLNNNRYSFIRRFAYRSVATEDGIKVARNNNGEPIYVNPTEPDSDWSLIDMRRLPDLITDE
jgi:hypothetical protein